MNKDIYEVFILGGVLLSYYFFFERLICRKRISSYLNTPCSTFVVVAVIEYSGGSRKRQLRGGKGLFGLRFQATTACH